MRTGERALSAGRFPALAGAVMVAALAGCSSSAPEEPPRPDGNVTDTADALTADQERELERIIEEGNTSTDSARVAVLTESEVSGDIEDRAREVADSWGVGEADADNGVLILVAIEDQEVRVEVADGARDAVTDDDAQAIVDSVMVPEFKDDDYAQGLADGTRAIYETATGQRDPAGEAATESAWWAAGVGGLSLAAVIGVLLRVWVVRRRKRVARENLEQARLQDPDLDLSEQQEEDYVRWAGGRKAADIYPVAAWLPLYLGHPQSYGATPPSLDPDTSGGGSSFSGGGGFTGGGATGSW